ncbi:MAG: glycoside hydrolase family 25 protein [Bacilli bacterium]|nr:glycoside hydrolase family 25 protein [Bacilli bacterium]
MKKFLPRVFLFIIGIIIIIGGIFIYNYLRVKYAKIEVTLKDNLTVEFLSELHVSDFIKSINGKIIDDYIIDSKKVGTKHIKFKFINDDKIKVSYEFDVDVIDTVKPMIWLGDNYRVKVGSDIDIVNSILCGDNYDSNPKCYIEGEYDLNTEGDYDLVYKAIDKSGNEETKPFTLNVYKPVKETKKDEENYTLFDDIKSMYKTDTNKIGLDISSHQGDIDFEKIKNSGVEFLMIRVGYKKGTDGEYVLDSKFKEYIENANKYGIKAGVYFYSYADSVEMARADANWVLSQIKDYKIDLPVCFDWEEWRYFNEFKISFYELTTMAEEFVKVVEKKGYKGMLYSSKKYLEYIWLKNDLDIWLAQYNDTVTYEGNYKIWQISDNGKIDGIKHPVDIDIMY